MIKEFLIGVLLFTGVFIVFGGIFMELAENPQYGYRTEISPMFQTAYTNSSTLRGVLANNTEISFDMDEEFANTTAEDYDDYWDITGGWLKSVDLVKDSFKTVYGFLKVINEYLHVPRVFIDILLAVVGILLLAAIIHVVMKVSP